MTVNLFSLQQPEENKMCGICLEDLVATPPRAVIGHLSYGIIHKFHQECIAPWFSVQNWCPICRLEILNAHQYRVINVNAQEEENDLEIVNVLQVIGLFVTVSYAIHKFLGWVR